MEESRADRLADLIEAASELAADERKRYLTDACQADPELLRRAMEVLACASPPDDFLERPVLARAAVDASDGFNLSPDFVLARRFRIVRLIGAGGMGEVYEAEDLELKTRVALKTIRGRTANDHSVSQFRKEVLQARSIAHEHVCKVYDLFATEMPSGTVRFLTMELLTGTTIAARLRERGPLPSAEVMTIATQVASALEAAHRQRIVHRDLKPSNVMLTGTDPSPRAIVMDFGLSIDLGELPDDFALPESQRDAGTEHYIAPEQRGAGTVGPPADVYAFGALIHEMLTGEPPIDGRTSPALPALYRKAIDAALAPDPNARPKNASDVLRLMRRRTPSSPARRALLVLVTLVLMSLLALVVRFLTTGPPISRSLVVADIANETDEPDMAGITDMVRYQLGQSPQFHLVDPSVVTETLARMVAPPDAPLSVPLARDVAWRVGADAIVSGRVRGHAPNYVLSVRFERRGLRPDVVGANSVRSFEARNRAELQGAIEDGSRWIRSTAGESADTIPLSDRPVEDVTSNSWEAVALFSRAQALAAQARARDALALFSEAVRLDPDFALAWMRMGDIQMSQRDTAAGSVSWTRAIESFKKRKLTSREDYRIRGLFASDMDDQSEAERVFRMYLLSYPDDFAPYFYIARPLVMLGRVDESIEMLKIAARKDPTAFSVPAQRAMFELRAGHLDDAAAQIDVLRQMNQPDWANCIQGQLEFLRGSYDLALKDFEALEHSTDSTLRSRAPALQAAVFAERGRVSEAITRLRRGADADAAAGDPVARSDKLLASADLLLDSKRLKECRDACVLSQQVDTSPLRTARAAALLARAGFPDDAEHLLGNLPTDQSSRRLQADRLRINGEILLARHRPLDAWAAFQKAGSLEAPGVLCEYLARGAASAGERGTALNLYAQMANTPGYYWRYPDAESPGSWRLALEQYLTLSRQLHSTSDISTVADKLAGLSRDDNPKPAK